jgi:hypothetical protein
MTVRVARMRQTVALQRRIVAPAIAEPTALA